ncbi:hypothetical protein ONS95_012233 [Cadophora gregata]|uniref:uncharacterized protein n=1 Tax=Cadophora gregata TaxID=51156 RepID=UPI0026DCCDC5|nr:uncharacterized protein ONS95_012233 [Cadophora gregata]KAK0117919.1 hypothetical protein ONS95_012233 [Cadophora gregata]KAK0122980.1 hypothetical protein ONS96_009999 [Cadophora gregata f. sp. sojae]
MSTPAAKRRRIDVASQTLSKPFRSPFKTPFKSPVTNVQAQHTTSTPAQTGAPLSSRIANTLLSNAPKPPSLPAPLSSSRAPRIKKTFSSPVAAAALNADPDIAPMLKAQSELEKQLREVKEALDSAEQARKIETDSQKRDHDGELDGELLELIEKWKGASRLAAEELFSKVRDRVNRMGGPRAWKEMQKQQEENRNSWDQEEQNYNNDSNDEKNKELETRDVYAEYSIDPETEIERSQREKSLGDTGELPGQEDEFTMAMMLRTLNVDLDIIGYHRGQQRWI